MIGVIETSDVSRTFGTVIVVAKIFEEDEWMLLGILEVFVDEVAVGSGGGLESEAKSVIYFFARANTVERFYSARID